MIQSQHSQTARHALAETIVLAKARKNLSFAQLTEGTGLSEAFVTAALLGQHALPAQAARSVADKLGLDDDAVLLLQMIRCAAASTIACQPTRPFTGSTKCCRCTARR